MQVLSTIAKILTSYADSDFTGAISKVHIYFENDPSDVPGMEQWRMVVKLLSFDDFDKQDSQGQVVPSRSKVWEVSSETPEACSIGMLTVLKEHLEAEHEIKQQETTAIERAMALMPENLSYTVVKSEEEMAKEVPPPEDDDAPDPVN